MIVIDTFGVWVGFTLHIAKGIKKIKKLFLRGVKTNSLWAQFSISDLQKCHPQPHV